MRLEQHFYTAKLTHDCYSLHFLFCLTLRFSNNDCHCLNQQEKRIFNNFHRQLFCTIDKWVELTMDDIRQMEAETQKELEEVSVNRT